MKKILFTSLSMAFVAITMLFTACQDYEAVNEVPTLSEEPQISSVGPHFVDVYYCYSPDDYYTDKVFYIADNAAMEGFMRYQSSRIEPYTYNNKHYSGCRYADISGLRPNTDYYVQYAYEHHCSHSDNVTVVTSPVTKFTTLSYSPTPYQFLLGRDFKRGSSDILGVFTPHGGSYVYETLIYSKDWMTPKTTIDDERPVYVIYPAPSSASQPESVPVSYTGQTLWYGAQTISPENPSATVSMLPYSANVTLNVTYKAASTGTSCTLRGGAIENVTSGGPISTSGTLNLTNGLFTATDGGKNQGYSWPGGSARITNGQKNTTTLTGVFPATFSDGQVQVRFQYDGNLENPEATVALPASTWKSGNSYTYNIEAQFSATGVKLSIVDVTIEEWGEGERLDGVTIEGEQPSTTNKTFEVGGVKFNMVKVEHGTFQMGSVAGESDETVHSVTISKDYYIGETEVTQALWKAVTGYSPTSSGFSWTSTYGLGDNYPAYYISYEDVQSFITKLNQMTGQQFRMPTEAEWEYAAKGGKQSKGYTYSGSNTIGDVAWYTVNSYDKGSSSPDYGTHPVKTKSPNELGIYDMSGNVWEWCSDWYTYYTSTAVTDPTGPTSGSCRVFRGGSWNDDAAYCHSAIRNLIKPSFSGDNLGFRLAL